MMDALEFVFSRINQPHRHHRHCVHNLSREEQLALRKKKYDGTEWSDEEMEAFGLNRNVIVITPDDWEDDVPDLEYSRISRDAMPDGSGE